MDRLSDYTALPSPHASEPSAARGDDSEEATSQQFSADPNAFAGLLRPHSVVVGARGASSARAGGALRLPVSEASQMSQPASQVHDALLDDTQQDEGATASPPPSPHDRDVIQTTGDATVPRQNGYGGGGGFLSALESRLPRSSVSAPAVGVDDQEETSVEMTSSQGEDDAMDTDSLSDHDVPSPARQTAASTRMGSDLEDNDAASERTVVNPVIEVEGGERGDDAYNSDVGSDDDRYRRDSMDSLPETQPLDEYEDEAGEHDVDGAGSGDDALPSTEAFADTIDQDAMLAVSSPDRERVVSPLAPSIPAAPINEPAKPVSSEEASAERKPQFLKRKQKAKSTLSSPDPNAFVDTGDQTLAELADRIRRERESKIQDVRSLVASKQSGRELSLDESQEDLTPTQPSTSSPEAVVHVALKKRGKVSQASIPELSASQEKSYEFIDSSCRCGEAVCVCAPVAPAAKPAPARTSSAIRNLEFAFAIPESQESESQLVDSLPDVGALALKTLQAAQNMVQPQSKKRTVEVSRPAPGIVGNCDEANAFETTPKKARRKTKDSSPSSVAGTPPTSRKRGRDFLSPDAGVAPNPKSHSRDVTPNKSSQTAKPPIAPAATPSSAIPTVRRRSRLLSPVPTASSSSSYSSRSKSLFKHERKFCLTGFTGEGLDNLTKLIEDYGGKVCQEDVLHRNNSAKVVVIATPVSWRKLKFMCAVACGIPVVHPEWIHGCIKARVAIPFDGFYVPSGCSSITGKFECLPVQQLDIFKGLRFGIPFDVDPSELDSTKRMSSLTAFILRECGAEVIQEDLKPSRDHPVDVIIADEYTKACDYYATKHRASVKTFAWVTECVILQRCLDLEAADFAPRLPHSVDAGQRGEITVPSATVPISNGVDLRLHNGEMLLVDLSDDGMIDHFLLFDVCEILSIRIPAPPGGNAGGKRKQVGGGGKSVKLEVGILERRPNSPALRRSHTRIIDLSPDKVKRRVVAVSKTDFDAMKYRDETIFYYEDT